jgi:hypothetical protein
MLDGIIPLADEVLAQLIQIHYPSWYKKCISVKYPKQVFYLFIFIFIYLFIIIY